MASRRHPKAGILTPLALTCKVCTATLSRASCQDVDTHSGRSRKAESKLPQMTVGLSTRLATSSSRSPEADSGMTPPTCSPTHQQGHAVECALACKAPVGRLQQLVRSSYCTRPRSRAAESRPQAKTAPLRRLPKRPPKWPCASQQSRAGLPPSEAAPSSCQQPGPAAAAVAHCAAPSCWAQPRGLHS